MTQARLAIAVTLLALLLSGCSLQQGLAQRSDSGTQQPVRAPAISALTLEGTPYDWAAVRGHRVLLDFWGSWCGPCRAAQPDINALYTRYAPQGVVFLGVDVRDDNAAGAAFQQTYHVPFPSVADPDEQLSADYDVIAPPTVIVIDSRGMIVQRFPGTLVGVRAALDRVR
jgi:thiol-disulfide isomerase/thioredoxin